MFKRFLMVIICFALQFNHFSFAQSVTEIVDNHKVTVIDFKSKEDVFSVVDTWAVEKKYNLRNATDTSKTYQRGQGFLTPPIILTVNQNDDLVHMESFLKVGFLARLNSLFILPSQISLYSGGIKAAIPRKMGRSDVNILLLRLNQEPIK